MSVKLDEKDLSILKLIQENSKLTAKQIAKKIAKFPEVQEVHIITGDWDLLVKLRAENVDSIGKFVVDKLRLIKGLEKTLTCMVFETVKETTEVALPPRKPAKA